MFSVFLFLFYLFFLFFFFKSARPVCNILHFNSIKITLKTFFALKKAICFAFLTQKLRIERQLFCPLKRTLRKHAHAIYSNISQLKNVLFQMNFLNIFLIFAQNIDCGNTLKPPQRGGSNEYPQSMFWNKNMKKMYTPVNPSFTI